MRADEGVANFVSDPFPEERENDRCRQISLPAGLILRGVANYDLPDCLRLTVGPEDANRRVADALAEFMRQT